MSHQPFETWILDHEAMSAEDRRALKTHLAGCQQCQRLDRRWQAVHQELHARTMAAPAPGFTQRWKTGLVERRAREQRKQAWRIFWILLASAVFILLILSGYFLATTSPTSWMISLVSAIDSSQAFLQWAIYVVQSWITSTPLAINLALWMYLTITLCLVLLAWVTVLWRTQSVGVLNR